MFDTCDSMPLPSLVCADCAHTKTWGAVMLAGREQELNRAHCMLDLALRMVQLLVIVGAQAELAAWVQSLNHSRPAASTWTSPGDSACVEGRPMHVGLVQAAWRCIVHKLPGPLLHIRVWNNTQKSRPAAL